MVFYRKYRPQTISELDLLHVREKLFAILKQGSPSFGNTQDVPHALLFTGPKGLGKTSSARIVAKAINCERLASKKEASRKSNEELNAKKSTLSMSKDLTLDPVSLEPCNECSTCISITNGSHIDVMEIDAASNRGVDEIRELRERVKFTPAQAFKKIYIIDEVHMLTTEAFNALLKTLEEPPPHVIFILCTTEMWKLPATIISRTFVVQFDKPSEEELIRSLARVTKNEGLEIEKSVLHEIYKRSEGSFRDASKIIEELSVSTKEKKIDARLFEAVYKSHAMNEIVFSLLEALSEKDIHKAISIVQDMAKAGYDFRIILELLTEYLRQLVFLRCTIKSSVQDISKLTIIDIKQLLDGVQTAYQEVRFSPIAQLPLELVVIEYCSSSVSSKHTIEKPKTEKEKVSPLSIKPTQAQAPVISDKSSDFFSTLIEQVKKENHSAAGILRSSKVEKDSDGQITLSTPYQFHADKLNDPKVLSLLEDKISAIKGIKYTVVIEMKKA